MADIHVSLERQQAAYHFKATNDLGHSIDIDDATAYESGNGNGVGPMQLLIMAIGGCSAVDIVSILEKSRQEIESFTMDVVGHKPDGQSPSLYDTIHVTYRLTGKVDADKTRRAINLSLGKYCSVSKTLEATAKISYDFSVNGDDFTGDPLS